MYRDKVLVEDEVVVSTAELEVYDSRSEAVFKEKPVYDFVKRAFDIAFSAVLLIVLSPVFLVTALCVKSDGGPAFFKQKRVGRGGKTFTIFKFRSMCNNADSPENLAKLKKFNEMDGPVFKIKNDPRITKVGRFIRKTSIDELPQLFNILKGDMTFVGPRPPLVSEVEQYSNHQKQRLTVKQGLTCYWQCSGRNNISFDEWVELDIKYINERGIFTDLKLILMTIPAVLSGKGAN